MSVDILGTNCDQCRSMVQCCFMSTETVRLIRTERPGLPPWLSHSSWSLKCDMMQFCLIYADQYNCIIRIYLIRREMELSSHSWTDLLSCCWVAPQQSLFRTLSLSLCSAQLLKEQVAEYTSRQSSEAVWKSRWPSWAFRPIEPYGFCGRKATLNHASALVTVCP